MLGATLAKWQKFMEGLRHQSTSVVGFSGSVVSDVPSLTLTTAGGPQTLTAKQFLSGYIRVNCDDAQTLNTPTAAQVYSALRGAEKGSAFEVVIANTGDSTLTISGGTGVTVTGTATIAAGYSKRFLYIAESSTTGTLYSLGTSLH